MALLALPRITSALARRAFTILHPCCTVHLNRGRKNKNGEYYSPIVSVIDIEMQDVIAASNGITYTIGDYSSGYSEEEDF